MRARIAWAFLALATLAAVADTAFTAAHRSLLSEATWAEHGWPLAPLAGIGCALMGALIVSRHPKQLLGWLLCVASLLSVTLAADAYSVWVLHGDGPGPDVWAHRAAWASPLLGWPAFTTLILVFMISPDGRLPSPRWRWAIWVTLTGLALHMLGDLTVHPDEVVVGRDFGHRSVTDPLLNVGVALVAAGLVASAASIAWRLRGAQGDRRRQILWIASSAAFLAFGVLVILAVPRIQGVEGTWLAALPLRLAQLAVPVCVAVAVLRHRLVQIDLFVNRAVVLTLATAFVTAGYVVVVVGTGSAVGRSAHGFWPSLLATALVALAFQPLRRTVVRAADRLAFGPAAAPYEALSDLTRRLGDSPDPSDLLPAVAESVARAVGAGRVTVALRVGAGPDLVAVWPTAGEVGTLSPAVQVRVGDRGEHLGHITVEMPAGRTLRPSERHLLTDLAERAGMAFRNVRLSAELSGKVVELGLRNRELAESRRRLINAADAERSRVERAIAQQVLRHLEPMPGRLRLLADPDRRSAASLNTASLNTASLDPLITSLTTALESLREITRGVFPAQLARSGLPMALTSLLARAPEPARLSVSDAAARRRFDPQVEAAAYYCVAEAISCLTGPILVTLDAPEGRLRLAVDGRPGGGLPEDHMRDRVEAAGGAVLMTRTAGRVLLEVSGSPPADGEAA